MVKMAEGIFGGNPEGFDQQSLCKEGCPLTFRNQNQRVVEKNMLCCVMRAIEGEGNENRLYA